MARQTFTKGQTVYCHRWNDTFRKAIVIRPDIAKAGQQTHYVGVRYINGKGEPEGHEWPITNRINLILTEEAFNEINRAKAADDLRGDMAAYASFERTFQPYFEQAEIICRTLLNTVGVANVEPADVSELAHYLRGMFTFTTPDSRRMTRDGVRTLRREKRATAAMAMGGLAAMGEDVPELAEEAGA